MTVLITGITAFRYTCDVEYISDIFSHPGINQIRVAARKKIAVFFEDNYDNYIEASKRADELRKNYDVVLFEKPKKLGKFLNSLLGKGFYGFIVCGQMEEIKIINS